MQTQESQVWGSAGLFPAVWCVIVLWWSPRAVKVPRAVEPPLGVGHLLEFLPCKGIGVRRVWHWTPCPESKKQLVTQIWIKSSERQFPVFNRHWLKVALSGLFLKTLNCSVFHELVWSGLFTMFCEFSINVWFAKCDFFLNHVLKTLRLLPGNVLF